jgi:hypothetical protein
MPENWHPDTGIQQNFFWQATAFQSPASLQPNLEASIWMRTFQFVNVKNTMGRQCASI